MKTAPAPRKPRGAGAFREHPRPVRRAGFSALAALDLLEEAEDLQVEPDQRDHQAEGAVPLHLLRRVAPRALVDSVGVIDSHFPDAHFFTEFERFDRHIDKMSRRGQKIDYVSICSPNYLHDAHCRFAMRSEAEAGCVVRRSTGPPPA